MNVKVVGLAFLATLLVLALCELIGLPRFTHAQTHSRVVKAHIALLAEARRIRAAARASGPPPGQGYSGRPSPGPAAALALDPTSKLGRDPIRCLKGGDSAWLLAARGPDGDADAVEADWLFDAGVANEPRWAVLHYDPTNGCYSNGDILIASWQKQPLESLR